MKTNIHKMTCLICCILVRLECTVPRLWCLLACVVGHMAMCACVYVVPEAGGFPHFLTKLFTHGYWLLTQVLGSMAESRSSSLILRTVAWLPLVVVVISL